MDELFGGFLDGQSTSAGQGFVAGESHSAGDGLGHPCGLGDAQPLTDGQVGQGMVVMVDGQAYDLGARASGDGVESHISPQQVGADDSVTLADDRGLSIYSDIDGDGTVDHVTTVLFDGSWETWHAEPTATTGETYLESEHSKTIGDWGAYEWEETSRGRWG